MSVRSNRTMARLGLAVTAGLLGLATVTAVATADPTDPSSPAPTSSPAPGTTSSTEEPPPSSSEQETPPGDDPPAEQLQDLQVTATFDETSYVTGERVTATVTVENTGAEPITTVASFPRHSDMVKPDGNPIADVTLDAGASVTRTVTGAVGDPDLTAAKLYVRLGSEAVHRDFSFPVKVTPKSDDRPLNTVLAVSTEFTKDTYAKDDAPTVRVTLTNKSHLALTSIVATCEHREPFPNLTGEGWGELSGGGMTIPADSTKVVEVTEAMPATSYDYGYVRVDCVFRQAGVDYGGNPSASDEAAVPGQSAEFSGEITNNDPQASRAGFRVILTHKGGGCPIVGEDTSDVAGRFSLGVLPVGQYEMFVVPPDKHWVFKYGNHVPVDVIANRDNDYYLIWVYGGVGDNPSLEQPPCGGPGGSGGPGGPGGNPPAPQGSALPDLAYTGASLVLPGLAGMVALLLGGGALLLSRRRRAS
jgi:LPXTG-motif cell wall-anchored protein